MSISRDPDRIPELSIEMMQCAEEYRLHPVNVVCDEPGAKVGDASGISFAALLPFLPAAGDRIQLEDGKICAVKRVYFKVARIQYGTRGEDVLSLMPNVVAELIQESS